MYMDLYIYIYTQIKFTDSLIFVLVVEKKSSLVLATVELNRLNT